VNFDFFLCIALGFKSLLWSFVFFLPVYIVGGIIGGVLAMMGNWIVGLAIFALLMLFWCILVPAAYTHMSMPVQTRGWLSPMLFPIFGKIWKPSVYCCMLALLALVPTSGVAGGLVLVGGTGLNDAIKALDEGGAIAREERAREEKKDAGPAAQKREIPKVDWVRTILPSIMYVISMGIVPLGAVFCMRPIGQFAYYFRKDLDLITSAPEHVYVARKRKDGAAHGIANPMQLGLTVTGVLVFIPFLICWLTIGMTKGMLEGVMYGAIVMVVCLPWALTFGGLFVIFEKAGESGGTLFVPIYNGMQMAKVAGKPSWWGLLLCIPAIGPILGILISAGIAKMFGKGIGYQVGCVFAPFIFFPMLGFGSAVYGDDGTSRRVRSDDDDDEDDDDDDEDDDHHH
ncbi:MAG TPA: DUF5684 domain-containing protein, partial [Planctomycetaceae bacterium]|nr:DUF5684 domain-containing protein [Planctomycetaceae bacterium]